MSGIYDFTLGAGGSQLISVPGTYFKVLTASGGTVRVRLDTGESYKLKPGQGARLPAGKWFRDLSIIDTSGGANVGTIFVGDSGSIDDRITGDVSIVDLIGTNVQTAQLSDNSLGFTATPFVAPGANPNGIILRSSMIESTAGAGGTTQVRLVAALTAPVAIVPAAQSIILNTGYSSGSGDVVRSYVFDQRRQIPPGWGLYHCKINATATASLAVITASFEVL